MKTITFYSYKGGVGRTLALVNIAKQLSDFGKKVCLLDFDLEAPGLPIKFRAQLLNITIQKGIVDYIYEFTENNIVPESIADYKVPVNVFQPYHGSINLIPAGNTHSNNYWKKLSSIHWDELFYTKSAEGVRFFLDLKEKIREEIKPDYLLIDSRTGFTETSAMTMSILADEVVFVVANNEENFTGITQLWKNLSNPNNTIKGTPPKIHFVLSRIPFVSVTSPVFVHTSSTNEKEVDKEFLFLLKIENRFKSSQLTLKSDSIMLIHSDPELELNEAKVNSKEAKIMLEYRNLFERLTEGDFTKEEKSRYDRIKEAEKLFKNAITTLGYSDKISLLSKAIDIIPNIDFLVERGWAYYSIGDYDASIKDFNKVIEIDKTNNTAYYAIAWSLCMLGKDKEALVNISKAVDLIPIEEYLQTKAFIYQKLEKLDLAQKIYEQILNTNPQSYNALNGLANLYRIIGKYDLALNYVYRSIELNPAFAIAYTTLAEIKSKLNQDEEFYINLETALRLNSGFGNEQKIDPEIFSEDSIYKKYYTQDRFKRIMEKYKINIDLPEENKVSN